MKPRRARCALLLALLCAVPSGSGAAPHAAKAGAAAPPVAVPPTGASRPVPPAAQPLQAVRGDHVRIEGKLYSPQALFVMSRRDEAFRRDAIVPQYLAAPSGTAFMPYALRSSAVPAPGAAPRP